MLEYGNYTIFDSKEEFLKDWTFDDVWGWRYDGYELMNTKDRRIFDNETIKDFIKKPPFAIRKWSNENGCGYSTASLDEALLTLLRKTNRQLKNLQKLKEDIMERLGEIDHY
jgi:hypothetical protein